MAGGAYPSFLLDCTAGAACATVSVAASISFSGGGTLTCSESKDLVWAQSVVVARGGDVGRRAGPLGEPQRLGSGLKQRARRRAWGPSLAGGGSVEAAKRRVRLP